MTALMAITGFLGALLIMHGMMILTYGYHAGGVSLVVGFVLLMQDLWDWDFSSWMATYFLSFLVGMGASFATWLLERKKFLASDNISPAIADLPFMPDLDRYATQAHRFELFLNAIVFYDSTNYCIGQISFSHYRLGDLSSAQLRPAGYGLVQKFKGTFTCRDKNTVDANGFAVRSCEFCRK